MLEGNQDSLERAGEAARGPTARTALAVETEAENGSVAVKVSDEELTRLDASVDTRPLLSVDVDADETTFEVPAGDGDGRRSSSRAYDGDRFAACRRVALLAASARRDLLGEQVHALVEARGCRTRG